MYVVGNKRSVLEWEMRLRIAVGATKGLVYLHKDCEFLFDNRYEDRLFRFFDTSRAMKLQAVEL